MQLDTLRWTSWVKSSNLTFCYFTECLFFQLNFGAQSFEMGHYTALSRYGSFINSKSVGKSPDPEATVLFVSIGFVI